MSQLSPVKLPVLCQFTSEKKTAGAMIITENPCSGLKQVKRKLMFTTQMTADLLMAHVYSIF